MINLTAITRIMAEHLLDDLDVGAGRNGEAGSGVAELVGGDVSDAGLVG